MTDGRLRERIRPATLLVVAAVVVGATYVEFVWLGPPTPYAIAVWAIVVPLLVAASIAGVREHPWYLPALYAGMVAIGALQYLDGAWQLLAAVFVVGGLAGLAGELTGWARISSA